ncbi:MAG: GNAT superfamily N-acetyltransferase [Ancylomarina sp.]|jgi:GNAT superfamily N-acetyltransferase
MNSQIVNNLYEFWKLIGKLKNKLSETESYSAVSMDGSDWPNRTFDLKNNTDSIDEILKLSQEEKLPGIITITKPNDLSSNANLELMFRQLNMSLDLKSFTNERYDNPNIKRVEKEEDSNDFAKTASDAFGYRVDSNVIFNIANNSEAIRLFIYKEKSECLGCGIIFIDSKNNAGLHMIGTTPKGRGKGIGKSMTEKLLIEAKENNANHCVLHASFMGEPIYRKLGFSPFEEIETYKILKKRNN